MGELAYGMLAVVYAGNREMSSVWVHVRVCANGGGGGGVGSGVAGWLEGGVFLWMGGRGHVGCAISWQ